MTLPEPLDFSDLPDEPAVDHINNYQETVEYDYSLNCYLFNEFKKQIHSVNKVLDDWFRNENKKFVYDIFNFIENSINKPPGIYATTAILGPQISDHDDILENAKLMLAKSIKTIEIINIEKENHRNIATFIEPYLADFQYDHILMIVEKADVIPMKTLNDLFIELGIFYNEGYDTSKIRRDPFHHHIMLLFCCATNGVPKAGLISQGVGRIVNFEPEFHRAVSNGFKNLKFNLTNGKNFKIKFNHKVCDTIYEQFVDCDSSLSNLKYLFRVALFYHYRSEAAVMTSDKKILSSKAIKKNLPKYIKELPSVVNEKDFGKKIDLSKSNIALNLAEKAIKVIEDYHDYLNNQVEYIYYLLEDPSKIAFPDHPDTIYYRIMSDNIRFFESNDFVDAFCACQKWDKKIIYARISDTLSKMTHYQRPKSLEHYPDLHDLFYQYKEKIDNNPDHISELVSEFLKMFHHSVARLDNPRIFACSEAIYFDDYKLLRHRCCTTRNELLPDLLNEKTDFGILYNIIHEGGDVLNGMDVYEEYKDKKGALNKQKPRDEIKQTKAPVVEFETRRKTRAHYRQSMMEIDENEDKHKGKNKTVMKIENNNDKEQTTEKLDESLLVSIYKKCIDDMVIMGLIDRVLVKRVLQIKKAVWL